MRVLMPAAALIFIIAERRFPCFDEFFYNTPEKMGGLYKDLH